jgi:autotransporter-associated beta strand protein
MRLFSLLLTTSVLVPLPALAQNIPTSPPVGFPNSTTPGVGTAISLLMDDYATLITSNPAVMTQNYQTVINMTQNRTADQTLKAIHDDRTAQPYSVMNGLGALTSYFLTGAGASASGIAPESLTPTNYATATLADYAKNINFGSNASAGTTTFGNGTATPLASAVAFINNVVRANSSTEPPKRVFERYQGPNPVIDPLDPRYGNYNASTNKGGLTTADTDSFVVPAYLSNFKVPPPYGNVSEWVKGFTVTADMIAANGGKPITAPNVGTFDSAGNFTPTTFNAGDYLPGIGTAPRPYRVSTDVNVPTLLNQVINSTNPYADGAFPSGHTNSSLLQALGVAFLVPQQGQELLTRAADLGNDRILAGMHSPLDVMGARIEATAIAATNIYSVLYDAHGNRIDWTNPADTAAYAVYQAYNQTQTYLANACHAVSVTACITSAQAAGFGATDPFGNAAQNKANYTAELTYGFQPIGPSQQLTASQVPVQAQVLLLTRFPYLSDAQRTEILATTGLASGYPVLSGNTQDGWGQLNLYAAFDGYGAFNSQVAVNMDAALGGYNAADAWNNDISGTGGLTKNGTGQLTLTGRDTYTGPTIVNGGVLLINGSIVAPTTVNSSGTFGGTGSTAGVTVNSGGTLMPGTLTTPGTLTVNGNLAMNAGSNLSLQITPTAASEIKVNGAAALTGATATAVIGAGMFMPGTRFTLLSAAPNGLSGTFDSVAFEGAFSKNVTTQLSYDAQGLFLSFGQAQLPALPAGANANANRIASALNGAAGRGAVFPTAFQNLFNLTPAGVGMTLNQLGSQTGAAVNESVNRAMDSFFSSVMDFGAPGRANLGGSPLGYAEASRPASRYGDAYAAVNKAPMATKSLTYVDPVRWTAWTSFFAGHDQFSGNASVGSQDVSTAIYGGTGGVDYLVSPDTAFGVAVSGGETHFSVGTGEDNGWSNFIQGGVYARHVIGDGYIAESIAGGSHDVHTQRNVAMFGTTTSSFTANTVAGRIEGGNRFSYGQVGLTPYAAVQVQSIFLPSYEETSGLGSGLAVNSAAQNTISARTELGGWIDGHVGVLAGKATLRGRLAWVHNFDRDPGVTEAFAELPGASFVIIGALRPSDAALVSALIEVPIAQNLVATAKVDGEFGDGETTVSGTGTLRVSW